MSAFDRVFRNRMSPRLFKWLLTLYPPFVGAGISVSHVAPDFSSATVRMHLRFYNANYWGTHFGGSLTSMTDPFFALLAIQRLGTGYYIWDKAAETEFVAPGRGTVSAEFEMGDEVIDQIRSEAASGEKVLPWFETTVCDESGAVVARVRRQLYIRRKPAQRPNPSAVAVQ